VTEQAQPSDGDGAGATLNGAATHRAGRAAPARPRAYPYRQPFTWWLRSRGSTLYMVRELTALPIAVWWVLFLVEVTRLGAGAGGYRPLEPWFVVVSVICLVAALWHTFTFLSLAGLIMRIPLGDRTVPGKVIVRAAFGGFVVVTAVIAALLVWGGA
jgi:fumarate reductase subunit C